MSETKNLKLFKHEEPLGTNNNKFDIDKALNQNWDKVDEYVEKVNTEITNLQNNKVDKEEGKGLSTNDFTNEEKEKLAGLNNYNDTEIIDLLPKVSNEGESITLENTARAKFTKFRIGGNSSQETRSGKNKVDFINYVETIFDSSKVEKLSDGSYKFKHCDTAYTLFEGLLKAPCTLSWYARNDGTTTTGAPTFNFKIFYEDGTAETLSYTTPPDFSLKTKVLTKNVIKIVNSYIGTSPLTIIKDVQLEKGSKATEYEQYGTMPSEEFSSKIRNVGDNGNLYDKDNPNILDTPIDTFGLGGNVKNTYKTVWIPCKPNTTYTVSKKYDATKNRFALAYSSTEPGYSQQVEGYVSNAYTNVMTITTNSTAKYLIAYVWIAGGSVTYQEMLDSIKIEKGTQATLDNGHGLGSMEIIICNKNILNQDLELFQGNYDNNGNVITNSDRRIDKYIFLAKGNYILWSTINNWINVLIYDKNKKLLSIKNSNANKEIAFTLDEDGYIRFGFNPTVESLKVFQLERNTEKTTSEEHKQQIIIFPFNKGQRLMEGDYLAEDGIHHKRKQIVLDGSDDEAWSLSTTNTSNQSRFTSKIIENEVKRPSSADEIANIICSHFIKESANETYQRSTGIAIHSNGSIYLYNDTFKEYTIDQFKTWLSNNPITVEYELAEEEIETYTEEQKEAYEQIKNAISYKGQTNIFSTNEIKPIFEVEALADIGLLLNNMQAQILAGGE